MTYPGTAREQRRWEFSLADIVQPTPKETYTGAVILVVEDNEVLRRGIELLLSADGFKVIQAMDGLEALERMQTQIPDLILSDISMPHMDGYALFEAVRSRPEWVPIPFIFLTAHGGREEVFESKKLGVEDYLVKPVNHQELLTTIRARLARSQELLLAQLQQAYEASLVMLANAIELRDRYTGKHVERVRDFSSIIAHQMGWAADQMVPLRYGSILHDIGKIYIREEILQKEGSLNPDEWEEMRLHSEIGTDLVKNIPFLHAAIPVIRHHHERWDGEGYPDGLKGQEIPAEARIVAVADSLDAITSNRIYQQALTREQAYQEIVEGSGCRYDPAVVEAFIACWPRIQERMG